MLSVKYISKEIKPMNVGKIKANVVSYELTEEDMNKVAALQTDEYKIQRFFLYKEWGSFGPTYPTLDHIIPLAKGGTHTWNNVQCACAMCNSEKRDIV